MSFLKNKEVKVELEENLDKDLLEGDYKIYFIQILFFEIISIHSFPSWQLWGGKNTVEKRRQYRGEN